MDSKRVVEIYQHYGIESDKKSVKDGTLKSVDFLIGNEADIGELTHDMAGFGTEQSQKVIIEYDKGYGYFLVKRILMDYGASEETP